MNIETIKAKQAELEKLIAQFQAQTAVIEIKPSTIELRPGERYAGAVLDDNGNHLYNLIYFAQRGRRLTWYKALKWTEEVGGTLPTCQEQALILANCKTHLEDDYYWSGEKCETKEAFAYHFGNGCPDIHHIDNALAVVAVRRV